MSYGVVEHSIRWPAHLARDHERDAHATNFSLWFTWDIQVQLDVDSVLDQVISFARIDEAKVLSVDREVGVDGNVCRTDLNCRRKTDGLLDAVNVKVSGNRMRRAICRAGLDLRRNEVRFGIFRNVKEIRRLQVLRQIGLVRLHRS